MELEEFKERVKEIIKENYQKNKNIEKKFQTFAKKNENEKEEIWKKMLMIVGEKNRIPGVNGVVSVYRMAEIILNTGIDFKCQGNKRFTRWKADTDFTLSLRSSNSSEKVQGNTVIVDNDKLQDGEPKCWFLYSKDKADTIHMTEEGLTFEEVCKWIKKEYKKSPQNKNADIEDIDDKQIIFYGPPGTGKTRRAKISAVKIIEKVTEEDNKSNEIEDLKKFKEYRDEGRIQIVQFHPGYSYNDFIESIDITE